MEGPSLLPEIIDLILTMANDDEYRREYGPRSILDVAEEIALKSRFRTPFITSVHRAMKIHNLWMALKCWLMVKHNTKEFPMFDFEIAIHNDNRVIHLDSVAVNCNPMPNGGNVTDFFIGDAYVFLIQGEPGVIYKQQVYKICGIQVPGYKKTEKNGMTFGQPKEDDLLRVTAHWFMKYEGKLERNERAFADSDSE